MRVNNDLGIFDFDDFAMEMTSTELLLVNGGACGGGFSGGSCGGNAGSDSGGGSSSSSGCGGSFNGESGTSVSYGNCGGGTIPTSNNCGGGYTGSGPSYTSSGCGGGNAEPTTGAWGQLTNEDAIKQKMQDYQNNDSIDDSMNGEGNEFSKVGCKMEGAAKILSEITDSKIDITDVNSMYDSNKDGLMTQEEISNAVKANLNDGQTFTYDYFEKTLTKSTLDSISQQDGVTYVLGRAENVHGGQHWIVLEGYSINSNGQVQFDYNGTSKNDVGRNYILGTPTDEQKNQNFYSISKIETYTIK